MSLQAQLEQRNAALSADLRAAQDAYRLISAELRDTSGQLEGLTVERDHFRVAASRSREECERLRAALRVERDWWDLAAKRGGMDVTYPMAVRACGQLDTALAGASEPPIDSSWCHRAPSNYHSHPGGATQCHFCGKTRATFTRAEAPAAIAHAVATEHARIVDETGKPRIDLWVPSAALPDTRELRAVLLECQSRMGHLPDLWHRIRRAIAALSGDTGGGT